MNKLFVSVFIVLFYNICCEEYPGYDNEKVERAQFGMTLDVEKKDVYLKKDPNQLVFQFGESGPGYGYKKEDKYKGKEYKEYKKDDNKYKKSGHQSYGGHEGYDTGYKGDLGYGAQTLYIADGHGTPAYEVQGYDDHQRYEIIDYGNGYAPKEYEVPNHGYISHAQPDHSYGAKGYPVNNVKHSYVSHGYGGKGYEDKGYGHKEYDDKGHGDKGYGGNKYENNKYQVHDNQESHDYGDQGYKDQGYGGHSHGDHGYENMQKSEQGKYEGNGLSVSTGKYVGPGEYQAMQHKAREVGYDKHYGPHRAGAVAYRPRYVRRPHNDLNYASDRVHNHYSQLVHPMDNFYHYYN